MGSWIQLGYINMFLTFPSSYAESPTNRHSSAEVIAVDISKIL